jgi:hypothetical protein
MTMKQRRDQDPILVLAFYADANNYVSTQPGLPAPVHSDMGARARRVLVALNPRHCERCAGQGCVGESPHLRPCTRCAATGLNKAARRILAEERTAYRVREAARLERERQIFDGERDGDDDEPDVNPG